LAEDASKGQEEPLAVVALFRAEDDAAATARRLAELGFAAALLPVFAPKAVRATPRRARYDAVLATSARAFPTPAPTAPDTSLFVTGSRTARAAEAAGWRLSAPPASDAAGLAALVRDRLPPGASVLYLAGRDRKPTLEQSLSGAYALETVEVYAAEARDAWALEEVEAFLRVGAALHYSRRSADLAARLAERSGAAAHFRGLIHFCLSRDAAAPIDALGAKTIVAARPEEPALLLALHAAFRALASETPQPIVPAKY
jgi:uroporphyrinogen-III synthase